MVEPTESEDLGELDRFADALIAIRGEIGDIVSGKVQAADSPLKHAPHTMAVVSASTWDRAYSRETGAFPAPWVRSHKQWPTVGRVDNVHGDRHLVCTCEPTESYADIGGLEKQIQEIKEVSGGWVVRCGGAVR